MTAHKRTLIKNGTVVTASDTFQSDVWIEGDKIVALTHASLRANWPTPDLEIDAHGKYVLPGGIDAHTHIYTTDALRQALAFGVTTELDMFTLPSILKPLRKLTDGNR